MCKARTNVLYGIAVRTSTLLFAIDAWPKLQGPLRFFGLLALRSRRRTFSAIGQAIERIPLEVWDMIKLQVAGSEVNDAEEELVGDLGQTLAGFPCPGGCCRGSKPLVWESLCDRPDGCEECWEIFCDYLPNLWHETNAKKLAKLLEPFGLVLGAPEVLKTNDKFLFDLTCATFLSLSIPSLFGAPSSPLEALWGGDEIPDGIAVAELPTALPSDTNARFSALVKLMRLEVLSVSQHASPPVYEERKYRKILQEHAIRTFKPVKLSELRPQWKVVTTCESNW
ncbi:hypothetical protein JCM11641_003050 [Rhodosporidiobolus odoratus]